jgi:hypothetical protein
MGYIFKLVRKKNNFVYRLAIDSFSFANFGKGKG